MATAKKGGAKNATNLTLGAELRMNGVGPLQASLTAARDDGGAVVIDAAQVGSVDAAALQLLYVFVEDCRRRDTPWRWQGVSDAFRQGATLLGLDAKLELPAVADA